MNQDTTPEKKFGAERPIIHIDWQGHKFVAVGNELHGSKSWKTFPDFLKYYIQFVLGAAWGQAELAKPFEERHEILKWYGRMCRFQQKQERQEDGLFEAVPNGAMKAYLLLAYDLYMLRHNSSLQQTLIERIKLKDQFQGARYELFAAATCIRAGCDIAYEDETDPTTKHTEFVATDKSTGQRISIEAKSRHRPGILGHPGGSRPEEEVRVRVTGLLNAALDKPAPHPYVIFIDLNLPPSPEPPFEKPWFPKILDGVNRAAGAGDEPDPFNLILFTNHPYHYGENDQPAPEASIHVVLARNPRLKCGHSRVLSAMVDAARAFGEIPNEFGEEGS